MVFRVGLRKVNEETEANVDNRYSRNAWGRNSCPRALAAVLSLVLTAHGRIIDFLARSTARVAIIEQLVGWKLGNGVRR